jgi:Yip1-like protein
MNLVERLQAILLRPRQTWPTIAAEPATPATIYRRWVLILAAIPAVATFIGWSLIGGGMFGISYRVPLATGIVQMVVGYLLSLLAVYVLALIVNALAPTFHGSKDFVAALKVVAYGSTAGFVGGVFDLLPALSWLALIASLYSIYLVYTGLPTLMRCPPEKAGAYTAVVVICGIVAAIVLAGVSSLFLGGRAGFGSRIGGGPGLQGTGGSVQIKTPDGATVTINPSAMADAAKRMEEAGKRMEAAQSSGDNAAAGKAMGDVLGALGGGGNVAPIAPAELKAMLPESIGDMKRTSIEAQGNEAMGIAASSAKASYANGDRHAELSIVDSGGLAGLATMAGWANLTMDKETDGKVEKVYKEGGRTIHEDYRKDGSHGETAVILANGVIVSAEGSKVDPATLKGMVQSVDLAKLEATKRVAKR